MGKIEIKDRIAILFLGLNAIIAQTIFLREFLSVFAGNELVIGIVLASWMVLTAYGAVLGKRMIDRQIGPHGPSILYLLISILPLSTVFFLNILRNSIFPIGTMIGILESLYCTFLLLAPYCMISGIGFTYLAGIVSLKSGSNRVGEVYSLEAAGSMVGGLIFNLGMVLFLTTFQSLLVLTLFDLGICFWLTRKSNRPVWSYSLLIGMVMVTAGIVWGDLDTLTKKYLFPGQELISFRDTPYGKLTVTRQGGQKNFYANNILLFSSEDIGPIEESVHYAMLQHSQPKKVLLISGEILRTTEEILKYPVERIDYVEIDPWLIHLGLDSPLSLTDKRIHVIPEDPRRFVRNSTQKYDVVLIHTPDPTTAQINRYYTVEFYTELKKRLNPGAVLSLSLMSSGEYMNEDSRRVTSVIYKTLHQLFAEIRIVPGSRNFFLASEGPLDIGIARKIHQRNFVNRYVNPQYLDDTMIRGRSQALQERIDPTVPVNRDFFPVAYYRQLIIWLSYFKINLWIPAAIGSIFLAGLVFKLKPISLGLFTGGFAASAIEVLLLITFQTLYGLMYQATGVLITVFMLGLVIGSGFGDKKKFTLDQFIRIQFLLGIYSVCLPLVLRGLQGSGMDYFGTYVFGLLILMVAVLVGLEFSMATKLYHGKITSIAGDLYSVDLIGSAVGALILSTYLLPLLGVEKVSFLIGLLCFMSAMVTRVNRKKLSGGTNSELAYGE